ncbi:hypothetical protein PAMP_013263 [Pampus punctatissimus]
MFLLNLVVLALLATSGNQSGIPRYVLGRWILNETPQYEETYTDSLEKETVWPESPAVTEQMMVEDQSFLTTFVMKEQDEKDKSTVWKMVLVAAVLLVSIVGCLSMAYYLCVWRGGRIHYQPQKEGYP